MATHKVHQYINTFSSEREVLVYATTFEPPKNSTDTNGRYPFKHNQTDSSKCSSDYKPAGNHHANITLSF